MNSPPPPRELATESDVKWLLHHDAAAFRIVSSLLAMQWQLVQKAHLN